jgi:hypothetical protein
MFLLLENHSSGNIRKIMISKNILNHKKFSRDTVNSYVALIGIFFFLHFSQIYKVQKQNAYYITSRRLINIHYLKLCTILVRQLRNTIPNGTMGSKTNAPDGS